MQTNVSRRGFGLFKTALRGHSPQTSGNPDLPNPREVLVGRPNESTTVVAPIPGTEAPAQAKPATGDAAKVKSAADSARMLVAQADQGALTVDELRRQLTEILRGLGPAKTAER